MAPDPSALFGGLYSVCIRDDWAVDAKAVRESVVFTLLGIGCSVLTVYGLSLLRAFV